jgi:succinate dehydrogenase / fumarate reductase cytochrome b subunit
MAIPHPASLFGRHEFVVRRLHSLLGLMPLGGFLCFHLATNAAVIDGPETFQRRADQIHVLGPTTLLILEWAVIFLPILFHGLVGLAIVSRGKRNLLHYAYRENFRYTLERATGVIAFLFIFWHVFHMHGWLRWEPWVDHVARPLGGAQFDPHDAPATAAAALQAHWAVVAAYLVGTLAVVYHFSNGIWTAGITWGLWTSENAQRRANVPCLIIGLALATVGVGAVVSMLRVSVPS